MTSIDIGSIDLHSIKVLHEGKGAVVFEVKHRTLGEIAVKTSFCFYQVMMNLMNCVKSGLDETLIIDRVRHCYEDNVAKRIAEEINVLKIVHGHRYIVEYYAESFLGLPAVVTKCYPMSLKDLVEVQGKRFSHREAVKLLIKIGSAISHVHKHGFVHGDIKPSNILIDSNGEPKLSDFSTAVRIDGSFAKAKGFTIGFSAPEQIERGLVYYTSDVYALASLYIYMRTGKTPSRIQLGEIVIPKIIKYALKTNPLERPDIGTFLNALKELIAEKEFRLEGLGKTFDLEPSKGKYVIGRDPNCDIVVSNGYVSRYHCELIYDEIENTWRVRDENSLNGTVVKQGDRIIPIFIGKRAKFNNYYHELASKDGIGVKELHLRNGDRVLLAYSFKTGKAQVEFRYVETIKNLDEQLL